MITESQLNYDRWAERLSCCVAGALDEFRPRLQPQDEIRAFALDCHPWNGVLVAAILTAREIAQDPVLASIDEMAAWKLYDFAAGLNAWKSTSRELAALMRKECERSSSDRAGRADRFFHACAQALATHRVQAALSGYGPIDRVALSVMHPDTRVEFYPPR